MYTSKVFSDLVGFNKAIKAYETEYNKLISSGLNTLVLQTKDNMADPWYIVYTDSDMPNVKNYFKEDLLENSLPKAYYRLIVQ